MKIKVGHAITYRDPETSVLYGSGLVTSITESEYTILWAGRGSKRYRRAILDEKLDVVFQRDEKRVDAAKEKQLQLGASKEGISFNEDYDRAKVKELCESLLNSKTPSAKSVADGLAGSLFTRKLALRAPVKTVLLQLAELCGNRKSNDAADAARQISQELFFGYVIQKSDFSELAEKLAEK